MGNPFYYLKFDAWSEWSKPGVVRGILCWLGFNCVGPGLVSYEVDALENSIIEHLKQEGYIDATGKMKIAVIQDPDDTTIGTTCISEAVLYSTLRFLYSGDNPVIQTEKPQVGAVLQNALDETWTATPPWYTAPFYVGYAKNLNGNEFSFIARLLKANYPYYVGSLGWTSYGSTEHIYCNDGIYHQPETKYEFEVYTSLEPFWKKVNKLSFKTPGHVYTIRGEGSPYCTRVVGGTMHIPFNVPNALEDISELGVFYADGQPMQAINTTFGYFQNLICSYNVTVPYEPPNPTPLIFYNQKHEGRYPFSCISVPFSGVHPLGITGATPGQLVAIGQDGGFTARDIPKGKKVKE